ncbi:hypothetical protein WJX81_005884 [Elliptochloris bilobata]|uniref:E3 ubiquitin-protein ligase CHFR n=1 Tax=Elliptochloris bilobata TaxID=381761 RepID=A0AAW1QHV1_9CHLO
MLRRVSLADEGSGTPAVVELGRLQPGGRLPVGRSCTEGVPLGSVEHPFLASRAHAVLTKGSNGDFLVTDLQSTNGTFVNDDKVQSAVLRDGDTLSFGGGRTISVSGSLEMNPFVFQVEGLAGMQTPSTSQPQPASGSRWQAAQETEPAVIDLTVDDDGVEEYEASSPAPQPPRQGVKRKREAMEAAPPPLPPPLPLGPPRGVLERLDHLKCAVCLEFMVAAHTVVPCGHAFCGECLAGWLDKNSTCPNCRAEASAPPVRSLPLDHTLEAVVEPALWADEAESRRQRRATWDALARQMTARWEVRFGARAPRGPPARAGAALGVLEGGAVSLRELMERLTNPTSIRNAVEEAQRQQLLHVHAMFNFREINPGPDAGFDAIRPPRRMRRTSYVVGYVGAGDPPSACENCGQMLLPNGLRVGYVNSPGHTQWMHVRCMSAARWRTVAARIEGLPTLAPPDMRMVTGLIGGTPIPVP